MNSPKRTVRPPAKRSLLRRLFTFKGLLGLFATALVLAVAAFAAAYALIDVPTPNQLARAETSIIYYSNGRDELTRFSTVNREAVPLSQVPTPVQRAMLAAEDRDFYDNPGISPTGIGRAVWAAVSGGGTQGGSTITQQYVKNYFLSQDQTLTRKARELVISLKIEKEQSKDEILANYLNTIYYGRGAYGIQAASRAYFGKPVDQVTVGEGALLASVVRGPSLYDPALGASQKKNARDRVRYVLDGMVGQGWLTAAQRRSVTFPETVAPKRASVQSGPNGYLSAMVRRELVSKVGMSEADLDRGGLRIVTTIDKQDQKAAIEAVNEKRPSGGKGDGVRVGLAAVVPGDGAIRALYGGSDYRKNQYSAATQAQMQGGSTFKVFTVVAALQQKISTHTMLDGDSPKYFKEFRGAGNASGEVHNFGNHSYGRLDVRRALAKSSNTAFAELNLKVGPKATREAAIALGIPAGTPGLSDNAANVFGTASPRVIDMANAYATLAAGGKRAEPYIIAKVTTSDDNAGGYTASPTVVEAVSADVAADALDAMRQVVTRGTAQRAQALGRPAAGKTGTTDENRAVWFDGVTPQLAAAVGMFLPDEKGNPQPLRGFGNGSEVTGGSYPVSIWTAFMRGALEGTQEQSFPPRAGIGDDRASQWQDSSDDDEEEGRRTSTPSPTTDGPSDSATGTPGPTGTWRPTDQYTPAPTGRPEEPGGGTSSRRPSQTRAPETGRQDKVGVSEPSRPAATRPAA